ncbi:MAG: glycoside hydrolase family 13 protein [Lachnospiraceae bacterium]|nr:glycoside hydrolase family 13 protein [Lachnospiraceae bacterium]
MDFNAVYHEANDNYCYPFNNDELIINIKTGYDIKSVNIIIGDPFANGILGGGEGWEGESEPVVFKKRLKNQLWWTTTVKPEYKRLKYYFELITDDEKWYYFEDGFLSDEQKNLAGRSRQCFVFPWMNPCDIATTPAWVNDTVWYQIFPDRFCNGDHTLDPENVLPWRSHKEPVLNEECFGGDLQGIITKLDYLKDLGITGIYMTPINESYSNHKYDTVDYTKIDPLFGDETVFKELVTRAHERGVRVMLDGVFNHSGYYFAPWQDVLSKGPSSEYFDWFMINTWPLSEGGGHAQKGEYYTFAFFDDMPKLNTNNPVVRKYFIDICAKWVEDYGVDGIRLDVANEVSHQFCKELRTRLKAINPDIYILGEIWHNALPWLRGDEFDAVMNYPLGESIKDFWIDKSLTNEDFEYTVNRCYTMYMQQTNDVLFNLLDSHDTKRLRSDVKSLDAYFAQLAVLFTMPGSPCIYYGTEIAMEGSYDPDCRRCMPWDAIEKGEYADRINIIRELIDLRKQEPLLKSRNFHFPNEYADHPRVIQFQKVGWSDNYIEIIINTSEEDVEIAQKGEVLFARHYIDTALLCNGILIRRIKE